MGGLGKKKMRDSGIYMGIIRCVRFCLSLILKFLNDFWSKKLKIGVTGNPCGGSLITNLLGGQLIVKYNYFCVFQVESLLLIVTHSSQLVMRRQHFERSMGDVVSLLNEQTSCHQAIAESLTELKVCRTNISFRILKYSILSYNGLSLSTNTFFLCC